MFDVFKEMRRMQEEMDRAFSRFFREGKPLLAKKGKELAKYRTPVTDVYETENAVIANIELPGVKKEDIMLNITEDAMEVKVEKRAEKEVRKKGAVAYAAAAQSFYRSFTLPAPVDPGKAKAQYSNGILRVEAPKIKKVKGKRLQIK